MKKHLYPLFLAASFSALSQSTGPLFKPSRVRTFYPPMGGTGWVLSQDHQFTYDQKGNVVLKIERSGLDVPVRKDSNVYSPSSKLLETHKYRWQGGKYVPESKAVNTFDAQDRPMGYFTFHWNGVWDLASGTESVRSYDPVAKVETEITKLYDATSDKWENFTKTVRELDGAGQPVKITYYSSDAQHNFYLFAREAYSGWHNYGKHIAKGTYSEHYVNGAWEVYSYDTTQKNGDDYVKTFTQVGGEEPGTYRILFDEDDTYREVMKQYGQNWLNISTYDQSGKIQKLVENTFEKDVRLESLTTEYEMDAQDRLIRNTQVTIGEQLDTTGFMESLIDISYDSRNLPLEEITRFTDSKKREDYKPARKVVYSDYVDVSVVTDLEREAYSNGQLARIYPNPGIGIFTVAETLSDAEASVFALDGQMIRKTRLQGNKLDISDLPTGVYQLLLNSGKGSFREKIVVVAP